MQSTIPPKAVADSPTSHQYPFRGLWLNGFMMILIDIVLLGLCIGSFMMQQLPFYIIGALLAIAFGFFSKGFIMLEPNQSLVLVFFGKYGGTFTRPGFYWINPLYSKVKVSLRFSNLNIDPIKVNDVMGNPILIGMVIVWRIEDTYKSVFDLDSSQSLKQFVAIQSDAALREVAGRYAYDDNETTDAHATLRSGGETVNRELLEKLNERLFMAGIIVDEARINYLAYAPEIAATMLKRQQATAVIAAREKIVDGAVGMVKMALDRLEHDQVAELTPEQRARITGNLLLVLCSDDSARPVIPA